jgi:hypothetical protein
MSVSPVLHILVGSLVALVVGAAGATVGLRTDPLNEGTNAEPVAANRTRPLRIHPMPLTILVIGVAAGSALGLYVRTNDFLGPSPRRLALKWAGTGLSPKDIETRIFYTLYAPPVAPKAEAETAQPASPSPAFAGGLFAVPLEDCQLLEGKQGSELGDRLKALGKPLASEVAKCQGSMACFEVIRDLVCAKDKSQSQ